jgi:hypothetical protein
MPNIGKRKCLAILERRSTVAKQYLQGLTQREIACTFGVNQATISRDLTAIEKDWRASSCHDLAERKAVELARIDHLKARAWESWNKSCEDSERSGRSAGDAGPGARKISAPRWYSHRTTKRGG